MAAAALISYVEPQSPFDDAGFVAGCAITSIDGHPLNDIIDWRWYSAEDVIEVSYIDTEGDMGSVVLERDSGCEWGIEFQNILFDGTRQCRNACTFCFMRQLPENARASLSLRDDDFRLSFLQGTFVTFTNMEDNDVERIIEQHISPLRYSLHAVTPSLRTQIIGKHAQRGFDVACRLLKAGIELHAQIVLMPGVNDGEELQKTLDWAYEQPCLISVGIVPVGYTKHQSAIAESFNSSDSARTIINLITPYQKRALEQRSSAWVHASDEFYRNAYPEDLLDKLPPSSYYGSYDLFEDGIGIIRSFIDDFNSCAAAQKETAHILRDTNHEVFFICGCAQKEFFTPLLERSPLNKLIHPLYVVNDYFGGNVDVTGLLCACDIIPAISKTNHENTKNTFFVIPEVIFNADGLTLDDKTLGDIRNDSGAEVYMVSCSASEFLPEIATIVCRRVQRHG